MIVATAGHVDHGKTSLLKALTGYGGDRLPQEKARGITIDLGFTYWPRPEGRIIGFVDVPGHHDYIHNMIPGAACADAFLLVVSAAEGIRPQTREHLEILRLLGVTQGMVALTKADLVDQGVLAARIAEISACLRQMDGLEAPIMPVSVIDGRGLAELGEALDRGASSLTPALSEGPPRVSIDRVFSKAGAGTIVTGHLASGEIRIGDRLRLDPAGASVRVRAVHAMGAAADRAVAGERVALNLAGVSVEDATRGDLLTAEGAARPTLAADVAIRWTNTGLRPITRPQPVTVHAGAARWTGRLHPWRHERETDLALLTFDRPMPLIGGQRLILRDAAARGLLGGAVVLDIAPPTRGRRTDERARALATIARSGPLQALPELLQLPPYGLEAGDFAASHALPVGAVLEAATAQSLLRLGREERQWLVHPAILLMVLRRMQDALARHHADAPEQPGLTEGRLRAALPIRPSQDVFRALVDLALARQDLARQGPWLRLPGHVPRLSAEHLALWAKIAPHLVDHAPIHPPKVGELAEQLSVRIETLRGLLKRVARRGDIVEIADDVFVSRNATSRVLHAALDASTAAGDGWFKAAAVRDRLGVGRKIVILYLEYFDRQGLTMRKDDARKTIPARIAAAGWMPQSP